MKKLRSEGVKTCFESCQMARIKGRIWIYTDRPRGPTHLTTMLEDSLGYCVYDGWEGRGAKSENTLKAKKRHDLPTST